MTPGVVEVCLNRAHYDELTTISGLEFPHICNFKSLTGQEAKELGFPASVGPGWVVYYPTLLAEGINCSYYRYKPDKPYGNKSAKYLSLSKTMPRVFRPINLKPGILLDVDEPLIITEGEKKAIKATQEGFNTIALAGVYAWKTKKTESGIIPDMEEISWYNRKVYIIYDSDVVTKPQVKEARNKLAEWLSQQGAFVYTLDLPHLPNDDKAGLDDYLIHYGSDDLQMLLSQAVLFEYVGLISAKEKFTKISNYLNTSYDNIDECTQSRFKRLLADVDNSDAIMLDTSLTGTGKTSVIKDFAKKYTNTNFRRIVLITQSPTKTAKELDLHDFVAIEGRNENSCKQFILCHSLINKGYNNISKLVCSSCSYKSSCKFLTNKSMATDKHIIVTPVSYEPENRDIVFIDESSFTLPLFKKRIITCNDLHSESMNLKNKEPNTSILLDSLEKLIYENQNRLKENNIPLNLKTLINDNALNLVAPVLDAFRNISTIDQEKALANSLDKSPWEYLRDYNNDPLNIPRSFLGPLFNWFKNKGKDGIVINNKLIIYYKNYDEWANIAKNVHKLYILDATPPLELDKILTDFTGKKVTTVSFDHVLRPRPVIKQFTNYAKYRNNNNKPSDKDLAVIKNIINAKKNQTIGILTFKEWKNPIKQFLVAEGIMNRVIIGHYGYDNRSTNNFNNCSTLICIGCFLPNVNEAKAIARTLSLSDQDLLINLPYLSNNNGLRPRYYNEYVHDCYNREILQAIGRIGRGSYTKDNLEVYLLTNVPIKAHVSLVQYENFTQSKEYIKEAQYRLIGNTKNITKEVLKRCQKVVDECIKNGEKITSYKLQKYANVSGGKAKEFLALIAQQKPILT